MTVVEQYRPLSFHAGSVCGKHRPSYGVRLICDHVNAHTDRFIHNQLQFRRFHGYSEQIFAFDIDHIVILYAKFFALPQSIVFAGMTALSAKRE